MQALENRDGWRNKLPREVSNTAGNFGRGLLAGLAGTVAITVSQMIEMKITRRNMSDTPVKAAGKVIGFEPKGEGEEAENNNKKLNNLVHFAYGTLWGTVRGMISSLGLKGWPATALHLSAVVGTAFFMLPSLKVAPPVKEWGAKSIVTEILHNAVYAVTAGLVFDKTDAYAC